MEKSKENQKVLSGQRIRFLRNTKGWTRQELGEHADVNTFTTITHRISAHPKTAFIKA